MAGDARPEPAPAAAPEVHLRSVRPSDDLFIAVCGLARGVRDLAEVPWADRARLERSAATVDADVRRHAEGPGRQRCLVVESAGVPLGIVRFREIDDRTVDVDEVALLPEHRSVELERAVVAALMPIERPGLDSVL